MIEELIEKKKSRRERVEENKKSGQFYIQKIRNKLAPKITQDSIFISLLTFCLLTLIGLNFGVRIFTSKKQKIVIHHTSFIAKKIFAKEISPTPSPSPAPTPTPIPSGFCLSIPVIYYHHIEPMAQAKAEGHSNLTVDNGIFDQQMQYLVSHGYRTISAEDLANALLTHQALGKAIVVTIDDGYVDTDIVALPILKKYGIHASVFIATGLTGNPGYMDWNQVRDLINSGLVSTYDHTWSHYSLPSGDVTKITYEIMTAKNQLEQYTGKPSGKIFAYPYGSSDQKTINVLRQNGFEAAFTTQPGFLQCDSFMFSLHRNHMGNAPLSAYGL